MVALVAISFALIPVQLFPDSVIKYSLKVTPKREKIPIGGMRWSGCVHRVTGRFTRVAFTRDQTGKHCQSKSEKKVMGRRAQYAWKENEATCMSLFSSRLPNYEAREGIIPIFCITFRTMMAPLPCRASCLKKCAVQFTISPGFL